MSERPTTPPSGGKQRGRSALLLWCQKTVSDDPYNLEVTDFGESWRDGLALAALLAANTSPEEINYEAVASEPSPGARLEVCFRVLGNLGIETSVDSADVLEAEAGSLISLISSVYFRFNKRRGGSKPPRLHRPGGSAGPLSAAARAATAARSTPGLVSQAPAPRVAMVRPLPRDPLLEPAMAAQVANVRVGAVGLVEPAPVAVSSVQPVAGNVAVINPSVARVATVTSATVGSVGSTGSSGSFKRNRIGSERLFDALAIDDEDGLDFDIDVEDADDTDDDFLEADYPGLGGPESSSSSDDAAVVEATAIRRKPRSGTLGTRFSGTGDGMTFTTSVGGGAGGVSPGDTGTDPADFGGEIGGRRRTMPSSNSDWAASLNAAQRKQYLQIKRALIADSGSSSSSSSSSSDGAGDGGGGGGLGSAAAVPVEDRELVRSMSAHFRDIHSLFSSDRPRSWRNRAMTEAAVPAAFSVAEAEQRERAQSVSADRANLRRATRIGGVEDDIIVRIIVPAINITKTVKVARAMSIGELMGLTFSKHAEIAAIEGVRETHFFFIPPQPQFESGGWLSDNNASFADFGLSDRVTVEFKSVLESGTTGAGNGLDPPPEMEGYLLKRDQKGLKKGWKKRFFVRQDKQLLYYRDDASSDPIGFIGFDDIGDVRVQATKGDGTVINIKTDRRTWVLRADSPNNARLWASGLRACAEYYRAVAAKAGADREVSSWIREQSATAKEGHLLKRGGVAGRSWQKRFFVCKNGFLFYYDKNHLKGKICLLDTAVEASSVGKRKHVILLSTANKKRVYQLAAADAPDMAEWMNIIESQRDAMEETLDWIEV